MRRMPARLANAMAIARRLGVTPIYARENGARMAARLTRHVASEITELHDKAKSRVRGGVRVRT
jgi:hypothetical protein